MEEKIINDVDLKKENQSEPRGEAEAEAKAEEEKSEAEAKAEEEYRIRRTEAMKYAAMADKILLARFREKYYTEALEILKKIPEVSDLEKNREKEDLAAELKRKLNEARACSVVEKYDFACKSKEYAVTSEDLGSAAAHFAEAGKARSAAGVEQELLSGEYLRLYRETEQAEEQQRECTEKAGRIYRKTRIRLIAGFLAAGLLCAGFLTCRHTSAYRTVMGRMQLLIGLNDNAVKNFERAYKWNACEETRQNYLSALKKAGMAAAGKGNLEKASEYLHLPALEGDEEAASEVTEAELKLLAETSVGEQVEFAGTQWIVIDRKENQFFLIRYEGLPSMAYQSDPEKAADWENSDVRAYLNGEYLTENFNSTEIAHIEKSEVTAEANASYGTDAGNTTSDYIYLLSNQEYEQYADRINASGHDCWLRTPGAYERSESFVNVEKEIMEYGYDASSDAMCLKPVLWVQTE